MLHAPALAVNAGQGQVCRLGQAAALQAAPQTVDGKGVNRHPLLGGGGAPSSGDTSGDACSSDGRVCAGGGAGTGASHAGGGCGRRGSGVSGRGCDRLHGGCLGGRDHGQLVGVGGLHRQCTEAGGARRASVGARGHTNLRPCMNSNGVSGWNYASAVLRHTELRSCSCIKSPAGWRMPRCSRG